MRRTKKQHRICVAGHVGVGHVFSHSGFVQDDSLGFAVVVRIVEELLDLNISIEDVSVTDGSIKVYTSLGGIGVGRPRRGLTPFEEEIVKGVRGDPLLLQYLALQAFGRFYGNGVDEVAVSLMYAISESVVDSIGRALPEAVCLRSNDDVSSDIVCGLNVDYDGVPLTILITVNGSRIGLGPCEDIEGNVYRGIKLKVLKLLGALGVPTVVVESKAYNPALTVDRKSFLVRYNGEVDNSVVAESLRESLEELGFPFLFLDSAFPLTRKPAIDRETSRFASRALRLIGSLSKARSSRNKAVILGELARLISEDAGGIVFMSSGINRLVRAVGLMPGTGAVLSMCVPRDYVDRYRIPFITERDISDMALVVRRAIHKLWGVFEEAQKELSLKMRRFGR